MPCKHRQILPIEAVVMDLDRTLLRSDRSISRFTMDTLDQCRRKGIRLVIASARPPRAIREIEELIHPDAVVSLNGAYVCVGGDAVSSILIGAEEVRRILVEIERALPGCRWSLETESGFYANFDASQVWADSCARMTTLETLPQIPAHKILVNLQGPEDSRALQRIEPGAAYLEVAYDKVGMIMHRDATKMSGVSRALEAMGVSAEHTAAFGDDLVDIGMLRGCGYGVAVFNALPEVMKAADFFTMSNDEDGVARWLEEYVDLT